ncbi:MAG: hypothetical protein QGH60_01095 [Phycisphaerae bacterium]|nr:hypothetical protein [Phycisphaerae bacterium]
MMAQRDCLDRERREQYRILAYSTVLLGLRKANMGSISIDQKCRPVRLGFLVRPGNKTDLRRAIEINTILWGGIYNPLIPLYKRTSAVWEDELLGMPTARGVLKGYIATFEPDFLVKPDDAEIPEDVFCDERVVAPSDVLSLPSGEKHHSICIGVDMRDVYDEAYEKVFRFVQRHPTKAIIPDVKGRLGLLASGLWPLGIVPLG